jgi:hypothetical protein
MSNIRQLEPPNEPPSELVECAIAKVLEIAQGQGITAADFVHMLDSGMQISDFLKAMEMEDVTDDGFSRSSTGNRSRRNFS